jgi:hypothetical protein
MVGNIYKIKTNHCEIKDDGVDYRLRSIIQQYQAIRNANPQYVMDDTIKSVMVLDYFLKKGGCICTDFAYSTKKGKVAKLIYPYKKIGELRSNIICQVSGKAYEEIKLIKCISIGTLLIEDKILPKAAYYRTGLNSLCYEILNSNVDVSKYEIYRP